MEKRISYDSFMSVKRVAQACNPFYAKRNKAKAQVEKYAKEYKEYDTQISSLEAGIKQITGFRVEDLVKKVIEPAVKEDGTPMLNAEGKQVKVTKYLPTDIVAYDKEHKQYVITIPDTEATEAPVMDETPTETETPAQTEVTPTTNVWD